MILNKKYLKAMIGISLIFCVGLVFFFMFAEPYGDGLEKTMEEGEIEEGEPTYKAPFDYGDNYLTALLMGLFGFVIVLICILFFAKFMRKKNETRDD
jgi:hypothetical protein